VTFTRGLILIAVVAFGAFAGTGCGGDDGDSASNETTAGNEASRQAGNDGGASESERPQEDGGSGKAADSDVFVQQATTICEKGRQQLLTKVGKAARELGDRFNTEAGEVEVARRAAAPEMEKQIEALSELSPPPSDEQRVDAFLAAWQQAVDTIKDGSQPLNQALAGIGKLAQQTGLPQCGYG
jgi:hypothetical protein